MFTVRADFDCGIYQNEWRLFVVRPNGAHIPELNFDMDDRIEAEEACEALNEALERYANNMPVQCVE